MVEDLFRAARRGAMNAETAAAGGSAGTAPAWMTLPGDAEHRDREPEVEAPESSWPVHDPDEVRLARPNGMSTMDNEPAGTGWRAWVRRITGGLIGPDPSTLERRVRAAEAVVRSSLDRPLAVLVARFGETGDATERVADTFGVLRGGSVVTWTPDGVGQPPTEEPVAAPVHDLAAGLSRVDRLTDLARFTRPRPTGVDVLPADGRPVSDLTGVLEVLRRFYTVVCLDAGDRPAAVAEADVLMVCCEATRAAVDSARLMLSRLRAGGHAGLAAGAVGVVSTQDRKVPAVARRMVCDQLRDGLRAVISIPPERRRAGPATTAWTFVCASIIDSFVDAEFDQEMEMSSEGCQRNEHHGDVLPRPAKQFRPDEGGHPLAR